ncbi:MAG: magnesium transporter [Acidimicrobiia bacterium]
MKFRIPRPRQFGSMVRELARRDPDEAEAYLDSHQDAWEELAERNPHDAADILEAIDEGGAADLLADLDTDDAADVLDEMRPEPAADVLQEFQPEDAAALISEMETDQAADVIEALDEAERIALLAALEPDAALEVEQLLAYDADTAGGMMTTDYAALPVGLTVGEAIEALRRLHGELGSNLLYVYVVSDADELLGVISFRDLVFARPAAGLDDVMEPNVVSVRTDTDREQVTDLVQRYRLIAIPVVDEHLKLVGMVKVAEALEAIQAEAGEDIAVMVGAGEEETVYTPVSLSIRRRLPWIAFNLGVGVFIAAVISQFEATLATYAVLAAYMPLIALLAGNSGAQSLAVIIRSMAVGDLPRGRAPRAIRREVTIGFVDGLIMACTAALVGALTIGLFQSSDSAEIDPLAMAVIVFVSVWVSFVAAGAVGAGIPVLLRRSGQDPAVASNIFLTLTTDIVGFSSFLISASILLS